MAKSYDISKLLIWEAFQSDKANGGSAGVDAESIDKFEGCLKDNLYKLRNAHVGGTHIGGPSGAKSGQTVLKERERGTPQGGVVSPILANLFLHYAFDAGKMFIFAHHPSCQIYHRMTQEVFIGQNM